MSRPVHEQLRVLRTDVLDLEVLPAAAVRARGRSRGRRQLAALTVAGAVVATTAGITFAWPQADTPDNGRMAGSPGISCALAVPKSPAGVRIRVLDGGAPAGRTAATAVQLHSRDFTVLDTTTDPDPDGTTTLRYGPSAVGAATLLRAALHGDATLRFDPERRDDTIDLTLGPAFTRLATTTEINQSLLAGDPPAPPQCSPGTPR